MKNENAIRKLRVNVKSLAYEAKTIRDEIRRTDDTDVKNALATHRAWRVKPEARLAHLALAFARGQKYKVAESKTNNPIGVVELTKKIDRFLWYDRDRKQKVQAWLEA